MAVAAVVIEVDGEQLTIDHARRAATDLLASNPHLVVGGLCTGSSERGGPAGPARPDPLAFVVSLVESGIPDGDPRGVMVGIAATGCFPRDTVVVSACQAGLVDAAEVVGCRVVRIDATTALESLVDAVASHQASTDGHGPVGLGPHPTPWPTDDRFDPDLLRAGDRRNVEDRYRYWSEAAIVADLDTTRSNLHIAIENWQHDLNIGTVVRNANAFNAAGVHIVGKRRWNRRGAMATDRYLTVHHHASVDEFASWCGDAGVPIVGVDNIEGSVPLDGARLPSPAALVFGQEGPGLSEAMVQACDLVVGITQHGSTRSLNAGVASGVAMYAWSLAWPQPGRVP